MNFESIKPLFLSLSIIDVNSYMILFCLFILQFNFFIFVLLVLLFHFSIDLFHNLLFFYYIILINFENLETSTFKRILRTLLFFIISLLFCLLNLIIVGRLYRQQEKFDENEENRFVLFIISFFISFVLDLIDFSLEQILECLTNKERQISFTNF